MSAQNDAPDAVDSLELAMLLRRVARRMARFHHGRDQGRQAQEHVLALVRRHGGMSQAELLERLDVRSSSLSELLAKLEKAGRVVRERNPEDRRGFVVTAAGDGERESPDGAMRQSAEVLFGVLDGQERRQLRALLEKLVAPLREVDDGPHGRGPGPGRRPGGGRGRRGGSGRHGRHDDGE
ncbi:MarR family transcriptional regulator [Solidesulfovibrio sp.]|uniref:MarR family winged helix-turn-helix transcriptional regulator n=1 Tax=Solidesulfovibrio sp. TaxID=2910990 RepID=UPI00262E2EB1|nr:MarR family transcriptional regulator [Solidesulfovibrio sp.]